MSSSETESKPTPLAPAVIKPGPDAQPPLDLAEDAARRKQKPSPTDRLEARADKHIDELQADKQRLQEEIKRLQTEVIVEFARTNESLRATLSQQSDYLARLETSYSWATRFNILSFICVTVGGVIVSYAAFIAPGSLLGQKLVADLGLGSLILGGLLQAVVSYYGSKSLNPKT